MRRLRWMLLLMVLIFAMGITAEAGNVNMNPGKWEITNELVMPGMPMKMPPMTHTQCITREELVPSDPNQQQSECKVQDVQVKNDTITWKIVCRQDGETMTSSGWITYSGNTFVGEFKTTVPGQGEMTNKMTGRRVGGCD